MVASQLAGMLQPDALSVISSPMRRARETAAPLAQTLDHEVAIDPAFSEVPGPVALSDRRAWLSDFMAAEWDTQPDALRSWRDTAIARLAAVQSDIAVFTHFLLINAVVSGITGRSQTVCFTPDNASITEIDCLNGQLRLVRLGQELATHIN